MKQVPRMCKPRINLPALNKQNEASIVVKALPYRDVVITSKRGSVTSRTKWKLKFETVMRLNTWREWRRGCRAYSGSVCFRKTMTARVENLLHHLFEVESRSLRQFGRWSFSFLYVLVDKKKLKFYSVVVAIRIFIFIFPSRSMRIPGCITD
jgi:hypothetical protein